MILLYLTSGLFLGWSLGANDAANVFGTAVGTRMLRFKTATFTCAVFVVIGAVTGGHGTTKTINSLGNVTSAPSAFIIALAAALTVFGIIRTHIPSSSSQAIIGAIVGWNIFSGFPNDLHTLSDIALAWILCPLISAFTAIVIYYLFHWLNPLIKIHLLIKDFYIRMGLLIAGIFGSLSLGANNVANVVGVFVNSLPFRDYGFFNLFTITAQMQLFFIGGLAISTGVITYSRKTMFAIGQSLFKLSPELALIAVLTQSLVMFLFTSQNIETWLSLHHLPTVPLVPVSSTQSVIGAITGMGLIRNSNGIKYKILGQMSLSWIATPVIAGILTWLLLKLTAYLMIIVTA